jgi:glycine/D-amino acid oxidase-like deaminating enzyme
VSLWHDTLPGSLRPRPPLSGCRTVDVAIVGAGYTGLWTAYYLLAADPALRVALVEREIAGFGASGRNGGWCSALWPVSVPTVVREHGPEAARRHYDALAGSVTEVARVSAAEGIDADIAVGGRIALARSQPQLARARAEAREHTAIGAQLDLLDAAEARRRLVASNVLGATFTPHCAAVHPAKLVRGLADVVEARGAAIHERTRALAVEPGVVHTDHGSLRADVVIRATEAYSSSLPGSRRLTVPVYSLVVATAPLSDRFWDEIGLRQRETFADYRHLIIYGQRTAEGRLVFGGRGAPYHFGSRIRSSYDHVPRVFGALTDALVELFPALAGVTITHRWGGAVAISQDWHPSVGLDRTTGIGWAGGYVGDGVAAANLAGRTLAQLILRQTSSLTELPWVGHRWRPWQPEPLRWTGANLALHAMRYADDAEARTGRASRLAPAVNRILGR